MGKASLTRSLAGDLAILLPAHRMPTAPHGPAPRTPATDAAQVGAWSTPGEDGSRRVVTAYAGMGWGELLVLADGEVGPEPSRRAAKAACDALVAAVRASGRSTAPTEASLLEALRDAQRASRRATLGTPAEAGATPGVAAVARTREGLLALASGGAVIVWLDETGGLRRLARSHVETVRVPDAAGVLAVLDPRTAGALAGDLDHQLRRPPPSLAARRAGELARGRGAVRSLGLQLIAYPDQSHRDAPHPALARLRRGDAPTFDADGRRVRTSRRPSASAGSAPALLGALMAGVLAGGATAVARHADAPPSPTDALPGLALRAGSPPPNVPEAVTAARSRVLEPEPPPAPEPLPGHEDRLANLASAFAEQSPRRAARKVAHQLGRARRAIGDEAYAEARDWVLASGGDLGHRVEVLLAVHARDGLHRATRAWAAEALASLAVEPSGDASRAPSGRPTAR